MYIVSVESRPAWRMLVLIVQFVISQINEDYYYYYYYYYCFSAQTMTGEIVEFQTA